MLFQEQQRDVHPGICSPQENHVYQKEDVGDTGLVYVLSDIVRAFR